MDPATQRHLGNYPQALTHAALLQASLSLRKESAKAAASLKACRGSYTHPSVAGTM
jgi:hypothetical protein